MKVLNQGCLSSLTAICGVFFSCYSASALTFNFNWTSNDPNIMSGAPANTLTATGTMDINVAPGQNFINGNISNVNITVSNSLGSSFQFTSWTQSGGTVAADGLSASFSSAGNPQYNTPTLYFGCKASQCGDDNPTSHFAVWIGGAQHNIFYNSQANALSSMRMTAASTEVPFDFSPEQGVALGLPLFIGLRMLKKRNAKINLAKQKLT